MFIAIKLSASTDEYFFLKLNISIDKAIPRTRKHIYIYIYIFIYIFILILFSYFYIVMINARRLLCVTNIMV